MDISTLQIHRGQGLPFRVSLEAVNKGVGLVALGLPFALLAISWLGNTCAGIDSISHYYYSRLGGDILVGALCLIGVLLAFFYKAPEPVDGYLGHTRLDIALARVAGLCAFGVALAPAAGSGCEDFSGSVVRLFLSGASGVTALDLEAARGALASGDQSQIEALAEAIRSTNAGFDFWGTLGVSSGLLTRVHYGAAAGMFLILAWYSLVVFTRPQSASAMSGDHNKTSKSWRNAFYRLFGVLILIAVAALGYKEAVLDDTGLAAWNRNNLTFWFEALALVAFGLSWSMKGRVFEALRDSGEPDPKKLA